MILTVVLAVSIVTVPSQITSAQVRAASASVDEHLLPPLPDDSQTDPGAKDVRFDDAVDAAHAELFQCTSYPSAKACAECHPKHFREWSVSPHAYAQLSPVFNAMSNKLIALTNGTLGDFCIRCHTPIGMSLNEPIAMSNLDRHPTSREGVTCVTCHRINQAWGKGAGRQALVPGDVTQVVYGPRGSDLLNQVLSNMDEYGALSTEPRNALRSRQIHRQSERFFQLTTSSFCGACHDVFAPNGFRLEDAFSEFKHSPAAACGQNCQDCHMGRTPGKAEGYDCEPAAIVGNRPTPPRKHTNHMMVGPDYSIIHPGIFPHSLEAVREEGDPDSQTGLASLREWLMFDERAGWGTEEFEAVVHPATGFPAAWQNPLRRRHGRRILDEQQKLLREADVQRYRLLTAGYHLGDIEVLGTSRNQLKFRIPVSNITPGHGVPTGFDAERVVYLRTQVWDAQGCLIFQSGDLDPNGDLRDSHSLYVHNGKIPLDRQLFSLQSRFITRNVRGGEREQVLNIAYSLDPLPYIRPETRPFTVLGRPISARKQKQNIEVGGQRYAEYQVPLRSGPLTIRVQLIAGMVPVNLIHEISSAGFDYFMTAEQVANAVVAGHMVLYEQTKVISE